uniref:Uncharacterized protein n=1 Tax=Tanacetum cinerariifolium TaxID=118510 RepID=A0A699T9E4_TANCI|nr:hypothetical protein [Tanacetum cinerariifolium]
MPGLNWSVHRTNYLTLGMVFMDYESRKGSKESFKQAVGTGELTVGMGDSTVSVSICSAEGLNAEALGLGFPLPSRT